MTRTSRSPKICKKYDALSILQDVSRVVSSSLDLDRVSRLVLKESIRALCADHAALFLKDSESGRLMLTRAEGFTENEMENIDLLAGWEAINRYLVKENKPLIANDVSRHSVFSAKSRSGLVRKLMPVQSFLAVPLEKDGSIIGTLIASNKRHPGRVFGREEEKLMATLSNHIAISLANARLFEELSAAQAEAAQSEKMAVIGMLSAGINHEIANPLNLAKARCDIFLLNLRDGLYKETAYEKLLDLSKGVMEDVVKNVDRAAAIARKLSNFAKPSNGEAEEVNIGAEIEEVLSIVGHELDLGNISVQKRIETGLPSIVVDRKQFQQVLFNLIRNAGQAIKGSGKITIGAHVLEKNTVVEISDTGSGIPRDKVKELFKPYFTTKEPGKGTGIGLYIVKKIVEKNGGQIYLKETKVGKGTTFAVSFPSTPKR